MKITKSIFTLLVIMLCSNFSYGQDIYDDTTLANRCKIKADKFNLNRKRDSSVIYYKKASEIYLDNYKRFKEVSILNNYIHCQSNLSYDLTSLGYIDDACDIAQNLFKLCEENLDSTNELFARTYLAIAYCYDIKQEFETAIDYYGKSLELYEEIGDTNNIYVARIYSNIAIIYYYFGMYYDAIEYSELSLKNMIAMYGEETTNSAALYNVTGVIYETLGEFEISLEYKLKALSIFRKVDGVQTVDVANVYLNLGGLYQRMLQYEKALEYYDLALNIYIYKFGENDINVANVYNNMAVVYNSKEEYSLALEYYLYARDLYLMKLGENHIKVALLYNNIGIVYEITGDFDKAFDYYNKALKIRKNLLGDKHPHIAVVYGNLGVLHMMNHKHDLAIDFFTKSLEIKKKTYGKDHVEITSELFNLGRIYKEKGELNTAIKYYEYALNIRKKFYGDKHIDIAWIYCNMGTAYYENRDFDQSLLYLQKAIIALVPEFNDKDIYTIPALKYVYNKKVFLTLLQNKVQVFYDYNDVKYADVLLKHAYVCDTLINQIRISTHTKIDKLELGEKSADLYYLASEICQYCAGNSNNRLEQKRYLNEAFYFSEKNKSAVLLEALAGSEAKKFAHLPDSLLKLENNLKSNIAFYKNELMLTSDSLKIVKYRNRLFNTNRHLDSLTCFFEKNYQDYYELKYNTDLVSLKEIQNLLDNETAIISYLSGDSIITIFTITNKNLDIKTVPAIENLADTIRYFRKGLIYTNSTRFAVFYKKYAYKMYNQLIQENVNSEIKNLIIIPDAELSMIPFETLLTENPEDREWKELPYLIKKYNISYSYSANLFYKTFPKEPTSKIEHTDLNDWLAFAPVFDDS